VAGTVARVTEISARSDTSFEDAVKVGLNRASATLRGVTSAWIKEQSVDVENGAIIGYRVNRWSPSYLNNPVYPGASSATG
jgi:flavin-binding protein dodecin